MDQMFATLDVTVHEGILPNHMKVLFTDTVGFISDVPTALVESFASTLEDIKNAVSCNIIAACSSIIAVIFLPSECHSPCKRH